MRYLLVTGPVRQKDGRMVVESQLRAVSEAQGSLTPEDMGIDTAEAVEMSRRPNEHERPVNGRWELDAEAKAAADEDARLRRMSPRERQEEAIERAEHRILQGLRAAGAISEAHERSYRQNMPAGKSPASPQSTV